MKTKAELQAENETLRGLVGDNYTISDSHFQAGISKKQATAVIELAKAIQETAKALQNNDTALSIGAKYYGEYEERS